MIISKEIKQIVSYTTVGVELEKFLQKIQTEQGYKVLSVTETKVNNIPRCSEQGFIVIYDTCDEEKT